MCVNARALAKFFQCSLMKLVPLSDRNFSVLPNGSTLCICIQIKRQSFKQF